MIIRLLPIAILAACDVGPEARPEPGPWENFVTTVEIDGTASTPQVPGGCEPSTLPIDPPAIEPDTAWDIGGVRASLYQLDPRAYGADWFGDGCFGLAPAGLRLDLTQLGCGVDHVQIPLTDGCAGGCTTVEVYAQGELVHRLQTTSSGDHTFVVANCGGLDTILIQSSEAVICPLDLW